MDEQNVHPLEQTREDTIVDPSEIMTSILADPTDIIVDNLSDASEYFQEPEPVEPVPEEQEAVAEETHSESLLSDFSESSLEEEELFHQYSSQVERSPLEPVIESPIDLSVATTTELQAPDLVSHNEVEKEFSGSLYENAAIEEESLNVPIIVNPPPYESISEKILSELDTKGHVKSESVFDLKAEEIPLPKPTEESHEEDEGTKKPNSRLNIILAVVIVVVIVVIILLVKFYLSDSNGSFPVVPPNNNNHQPPKHDHPIVVPPATLISQTAAYLKRSMVARVVTGLFLTTLAFAIGFTIYMALLRAHVVPLHAV